MKAARPPLSLKARALRWLAQREHTRLELRRKLLQAARRRDAQAPGAGPRDPPADPAAEVDALLDWLLAERHLSEARFVESRVHARQARFGGQRIAQELKHHGVALDPASAERLRATEAERAQAVWARKFGPSPSRDPAERARQMRFLAGRGFASDVIRRVVRGDDDS